MTSPGKYTHKISDSGGWWWLAGVVGDKIYFGPLHNRNDMVVEPADYDPLQVGKKTVEDFYSGRPDLSLVKINTFKGNK